MKNILLVTLLFIIFLIIGCKSAQETISEKSNKNKAIALLKSLETGDKSIIEKYVSNDNLIQHNPALPDGRDALLGVLEQMKQAKAKVNVIRVISEGDYVVLHIEYLMAESKIVGLDILRFEKGKIVEIWDNTQNNVKKTINGHTMTDGNTKISNRNKTKVNKLLVKNFIDSIMIKGEFEKITNYFDGDNLIQHNPMIPDTLSGALKAIEEMGKKGITMKYNKIHMIIGQGNFVLAVSEGTIGKNSTSFYDLYRIENNKIVEHWDTIEPIIPKEQWKNQNGKF